jgi:hypothetical protein
MGCNIHYGSYSTPASIGVARHLIEYSLNSSNYGSPLQEKVIAIETRTNGFDEGGEKQTSFLKFALIIVPVFSERNFQIFVYCENQDHDYLNRYSNISNTLI